MLIQGKQPVPKTSARRGTAVASPPVQLTTGAASTSHQARQQGVENGRPPATQGTRGGVQQTVGEPGKQATAVLLSLPLTLLSSKWLPT